MPFPKFQANIAKKASAEANGNEISNLIMPSRLLYWHFVNIPSNSWQSRKIMLSLTCRIMERTITTMPTETGFILILSAALGND